MNPANHHTPAPPGATPMEGIDFKKYLEKSRRDYLDLRAPLEGLAKELSRLNKQHRATEATGKEAGEKWRTLFKEAMGNASEEVRRLQAEEHAMAGELEQLSELIAELEPQVETQRVKVAGARAAYLSNLKRARQQHDREQLETSAEALLSSESAKPFLEALVGRIANAEREMLDDASFMARQGYDAPMKEGWYASIGQFPDAVRPILRRELENRENQVIADAVRRYLPDSVPAGELPEQLQPIERLECEAQEGRYESRLAVDKRVREINQGKLDDEPDPRGDAWGESVATMRGLYLANAQ